TVAFVAPASAVPSGPAPVSATPATRPAAARRPIPLLQCPAKPANLMAHPLPSTGPVATLHGRPCARLAAVCRPDVAFSRLPENPLARRRGGSMSTTRCAVRAPRARKDGAWRRHLHGARAAKVGDGPDQGAPRRPHARGRRRRPAG